MGTAFTYQGRLAEGGNPAHGLYDFTFALFTAPTGGTYLGSVGTNALSVSNGLFTVSLDFGPGLFNGDARWLVISVRTNAPVSMVTLTPRQPLQPAPYALMAGSASNVLGTVPDTLLSPNIARLNQPQTFASNTLFTAPVGIGIGPGDARLDVNGPLRLNNHDLFLRHSTDRNHGLGYYGLNYTNKPFAGLSVDGPVLYGWSGGVLGTTGSSTQRAVLVWNSSGLVGIGTNTPSTALEVAGTVKASAFDGEGTFGWQVVTVTSQQLEPHHGYVANHSSSRINFLLPTVPAAGDVVRVSGLGAGGWAIAQNAGQSVLLKPLGLAGAVWTARDSVRSWKAVASSADGNKLVAAVSGGQIYTSTNAGVSWTPRAVSMNWNALASSADGTRLVSAPQDGQLFVSADSGQTWTARANSRTWVSVAASADGKRLVGTAFNSQIYTSADGGTNWTARHLNTNWASVVCSADGLTIMAAQLWSPTIHLSGDGGTNWLFTMEAPSPVGSMAASADAMKLCSVGFVMFLQTTLRTSTDQGMTWASRAAGQNWSSVASSANGNRLAAAVDGGPIWISSDAGANWTTNGPTQNWKGVASSTDGTKLVAVASGGRIYTSSPVTTTGTSGGLTGDVDAAIELQYVGNGQWRVLSHAGSVAAF